VTGLLLGDVNQSLDSKCLDLNYLRRRVGLGLLRIGKSSSDIYDLICYGSFSAVESFLVCYVCAVFLLSRLGLSCSIRNLPRSPFCFSYSSGNDYSWLSSCG
jgi:hypothetical protein